MPGSVPPTGPIAAVIARMQALAAGLPAGDGVGDFNHLYLEVTGDVAQNQAGTTFADPVYMGELDVTFAGLYFKAADAAAAGSKLPRCWRPLFDARDDRRIAPIQFALAGMNAHINHDLPVALVQTCAAHGVQPTLGCPQHTDYERINGLLAQVEARVKAEYATGLIGVADDVLGRLDDVIAMWSIGAARDAAWQHAQMLWEIRAVPELYDGVLDALDGLVGMAGRGLLVPVLES